MLKHIGVGEEFECVVVRIGDRDVIVFASEGFDRREILPVGGKKEMRPFALVFLAHQRPPVAGDALSVFHAGPLEMAGKPLSMLQWHTAVPGPDNHLRSPVVINVSP